MKRIVIKVIELYQHTLSPDTGWFSARFAGGYCRYTPHCSEYGKQAVERYGAGKGLVLAFWRVLRCNPWSGGGSDPVE